jgi:hypothetical protein
MPANHCVPHTAEAKAKMSAARKGKPAPWKHRASRVVNGVLHYQCGRCREFFPRDDFYANKRTVLGIKSECRKCHTATTIKSRDQELARKTNAAYMARARAADPETFRARERVASRGRVKDEKTAARAALNNAVKRGDVVKPKTCESCGEERRLTGHHDDYTAPLQVRWLCYGCHGREHRRVQP